MGAWARLRNNQLRESQQGAVTLEAALGIGALVVIATVLVQAVGVVVIYLQMLTLTYETLRIATASGDIPTRIWQAESFVESQNPAIQTEFRIADDSVELTLQAPLPVKVPGLPHQIEISRRGLLVDQAIW